ncbi:ATP synthase F1 subunit delta [Bdellovibrionota bacterium FG-2]
MSLARSYAKALYEAAIESGATPEILDRIELQFDLFVKAIDGSKEVKTALSGPLVTTAEKVEVVRAVAKKIDLVPLLARFIELIAKKRRMPALNEIRLAAIEVRLASEGGVSARLETAEPLSTADVDGLVKSFQRKLGKKLAFRVSTDPRLLAGLRVTVNGVSYDGTLQSRLQRLRDSAVAGIKGNA